MKKSILTFALFSLVVLTSFTTLNSPAETGDDDTGTPTTTTTTADRTDSGGHILGSNTKKNDDITTVLPYTAQYQNQEILTRKKTDF